MNDTQNNISPKSAKIVGQWRYDASPLTACRIDPTGKFLIAANQNSDNLVVFKIDSKTGQLEFSGKELSVPSPVCVRFLALSSLKGAVN